MVGAAARAPASRQRCHSFAAATGVALPCAAMDDTTALDRMRAVEARYLSLSGSADTTAVRAGVERLRAQLAETRTRERDQVFTVSIPDPCGRSVFIALCRRYGLDPHRHARQRRSTVVVAAPPSFYDRVLWPEFQALTDVLYEHFLSITMRALDDVLMTGGDEAITIDRHDDP